MMRACYRVVAQKVAGAYLNCRPPPYRCTSEISTCARAMANLAATGVTQQAVHTLNDTEYLAYRYTAPTGAEQPCVVFIHGLCSNMTGTKAAALEGHAAAKGFGCLCFDTRGHGSSSGTFEGTHIGDWYTDTETALLQLTGTTKNILVGSSLGGWLALHLALDHPDKVAGLVLIAPALDFTERIWARLSPQQQADAQRDRRTPIASNYMEPVYASMGLIEEGRKLLLLHKLRSLQVKCPIRILHGIQDDAVPVAVGQQLFEQLPAQDMVLTLIKDGDHRLARPQDLRLMLSTLDGIVQSL